jgi:hypothetical protein
MKIKRWKTPPAPEETWTPPNSCVRICAQRSNASTHSANLPHHKLTDFCPEPRRPSRPSLGVQRTTSRNRPILYNVMVIAKCKKKKKMNYIEIVVSEAIIVKWTFSDWTTQIDKQKSICFSRSRCNSAITTLFVGQNTFQKKPTYSKICVAPDHSMINTGNLARSITDETAESAFRNESDSLSRSICLGRISIGN